MTNTSGDSGLRRRHEHELEHARLHGVATGHADGLAWTVDRDFRFVGVSDEFARLLGWQRLHLIGEDARQFSFDRPRAHRLAEQLARDGSLVNVVELVPHRGEHVDVAYRIRRVGDLFVAAGALFTPPRGHGPDEYLTREQAAHEMNLSTSTVDRMRADGRLQWVATGPHGAVRIMRRWCHEALARAGGAGGLLALLAALVLLAYVCRGCGTAHAVLRHFGLEHGHRHALAALPRRAR